MEPNKFIRLNSFFKRLYAVNQAWFAARKVIGDDDVRIEALSMLIDDTGINIDKMYGLLNEIQREAKSRINQADQQS